jgi:D-alanyl-D-alanine carboxypeptidase
MKAPLVALGLAVALVGCSNQATESPDPEAELVRVVEEWRERTPVPGVVATLAGKEIGRHEIASGTLRRDGEQPVAVSTPFRVASVTKTLLAVVVLQLVEEGRLSLDEPVIDLLTEPAPGDRLSSLLEGVTVRDLLAHTSGLPDTARSPELIDAIEAEPERAWTTEEVLAVVSDRAREFDPGTGFGYSNTNYLIAGLVIEAVTGEPWWEEVRARVLDPLGMTGSHLAGYEGPVGSLAPGYFDMDNDGFTEEVPQPWSALDTSEGASGALVSTAPDLIRFMTALVKGGLVSDASLSEMITVGPFASRFTGYGLGIEVLQPDLETTVWGHGGFLPGHRTVLWYAPEHEMTIVVLTNESRSRPDALAELLLHVGTREQVESDVSEAD